MGEPPQITCAVENHRAQWVGVKPDQHKDRPRIAFIVDTFQDVRRCAQVDLDAHRRKIVEDDGASDIPRRPALMGTGIEGLLTGERSRQQPGHDTAVIVCGAPAHQRSRPKHPVALRHAMFAGDRTPLPGANSIDTSSLSVPTPPSYMGHQGQF